MLLLYSTGLFDSIIKYKKYHHEKELVNVPLYSNYIIWLNNEFFSDKI